MRAKIYALNSSYCLLMLGGASGQPGVGDRLNCDSLGYKFIEQLPTVSRGSTVEPKRKLVEIRVELFTGQYALVGTHQPAFQQGRYPVHAGQQGRRCFAVGIDQARLVPGAFLL